MPLSPPPPPPNAIAAANDFSAAFGARAHVRTASHRHTMKCPLPPPRPPLKCSVGTNYGLEFAKTPSNSVRTLGPQIRYGSGGEKIHALTQWPLLHNNANCEPPKNSQKLTSVSEWRHVVCTTNGMAVSQYHTEPKGCNFPLGSCGLSWLSNPTPWRQAHTPVTSQPPPPPDTRATLHHSYIALAGGRVKRLL